ncbi:MAG: protein translocase subunit SecF [Candidatus Eremiobacteraeota bacterium]|nr:protein translocase subunit SecF [Candidatus Eremiobacteraeota bacterium]
MEYISLIFWIVALIGLVAWGQTFKTRQYDMVGARHIFVGISAVILLVSIGSLATRGLNWGLDFTGGTIIEAGSYKEVTPDDVRQALQGFEGIGGTTVQVGAGMVEDQAAAEGEPTQYQKVLVRVSKEGGLPLSTDEARALFDHLGEKLGTLKELRIASIGPTISGELARNAVLAVALALVLQLVYIFLRFGSQMRYGVAADVALIHDVIIMVGIYSLAGRELDSPFVAALLTVVGYSVMDSVVIFDRIRENVQIRRHVPFEKLVNESVNQTMTRSINTTLTTLVTLIGIYYFGGSTLKDFAFALLVGIGSGAYSSICVACPVLVEIDKRVKAGSEPTSASAPAAAVDDDSEEEDEEADELEAVGAGAGKGKRKRRRGSRSKKS